MVTIRPAKTTDMDAILGIESAQFGVDAWNAQMVLGELTADYNRYFVATSETGQIVGYGGIALALDDADVHTIGVAEQCKRRGIGRELMNHMWEQSISAGVRRMFLEVREDNAPAIALYNSLGFETIGKREHYYNDGCAAFVMRKLVQQESE